MKNASSFAFTQRLLIVLIVYFLTAVSIANGREYTVSQVYSSDSWSNNPCINNHGDIIWQSQLTDITEIHVLRNGQPNSTIIASNSNVYYKALINDNNDIIYSIGSTEPLNLSMPQLFLLKNGETSTISFGDAYDFFDINNHGDIIWKGLNGTFFLEANTNTPVSLSLLNDYPSQIHINDINSIIWEGFDSLRRIDQLNLLEYGQTTPQTIIEPNTFLGDFDINNSQDIVYITQTDVVTGIFYLAFGSTIPEFIAPAFHSPILNDTSDILWSENGSLYLFEQGQDQPQFIALHDGTSYSLNNNGEIVFSKDGDIYIAKPVVAIPEPSAILLFNLSFLWLIRQTFTLKKYD